MPATVLTPTIREEIERLGRADIMVGIPSFKNAATIGYVVRAAQTPLGLIFLIAIIALLTLRWGLRHGWRLSLPRLAPVASA